MKQKITASTKYTIPAVCTAMELMRLLSEGNGESTTKGLAYSLDVPRTTCYRILRSLIAKDWIRPVTGGYHEISLGLLPMLQPLRQVEQLANTVQPALEMLAMRSQLTAKVTVRQGDYAVTIARCVSPQETSVAVRQGAAFHLAVGSSGTVLMSGLAHEEVQQILDRAPEECWIHQKPEDIFSRLKEFHTRGWCADMGSFRPSIHTISVPLRDMHDDILAAMTIIGFPHELPPERLSTPTKMLLDAARRAERELRKHSLDQPPKVKTKSEETEQ